MQRAIIAQSKIICCDYCWRLLLLCPKSIGFSSWDFPKLQKGSIDLEVCRGCALGPCTGIRPAGKVRCTKYEFNTGAQWSDFSSTIPTLRAVKFPGFQTSGHPVALLLALNSTSYTIRHVSRTLKLDSYNVSSMSIEQLSVVGSCNCIGRCKLLFDRLTDGGARNVCVHGCLQDICTGHYPRDQLIPRFW